MTAAPSKPGISQSPGDEAGTEVMPGDALGSETGSGIAGAKEAVGSGASVGDGLGAGVPALVASADGLGVALGRARVAVRSDGCVALGAGIDTGGVALGAGIVTGVPSGRGVPEDEGIGLSGSTGPCTRGAGVCLGAGRR
jgi:hypothetical protein